VKKKYIPNSTFLDDEERELEHLDPTTAFPKDVQERMLAPYRSETRKNVTMRLSESVITGLKSKAEADGIPYQTLASMILQKYIRGSLLDKDTVKEVVKAFQQETATSGRS
jgi:predicted DNA binding CopG/RHH family protein